MPRTPPWNKPAPKTSKAPVRLTDAQKEAARKRAERAGRRYPNLVDNMWATRQHRSGK